MRTSRGPSLFGQVSRLVATQRRTPAEDRLTECFAALLQRTPGLALHLARHWVEPAADGGGVGERAGESAATRTALDAMPDDALRRVATQVAVPGGRVDLELRFAVDPGVRADAVVVRIEVKHRIHPHSEQLRTYELTMPLTGRSHAVVLLAPRADLPYTDPTQVPPTVPQRSWQHTARIIENYVIDDPVAAWLRDEFCVYLREEQLMDPRALRPEHLTALEYTTEAWEALGLICARADEHLQENAVLGAPDERWHPRPGRYGARWGRPEGFDPERWNGAWFDWGTDVNNPEVGMSGAYIYAGLSIEKRGRFDAGATRSDWLAELEAGVNAPEDAVGDPVVFASWSGGNERRLRRVALPQDVLRGATLEAQGNNLGRWVEDTYRTLLAHGPPS